MAAWDGPTDRRERAADRPRRGDGGRGPIRRPDTLAAEEPLEIRVGAAGPGRRRPLAVTMRTPGDDLDLAIGFLLTEGLIRSADDVLTAQLCAGDGDAEHVQRGGRGARRRTCRRRRPTRPATSTPPAPAGSAARRASTRCAPGRASPSPTTRWPCRADGARRAAGPAARRAAGLRRGPAGCTRPGSSPPTASWSCCARTSGRHNAVDKVIGWAVRERRLPLAGHVLLVSGRASFELTQKAWMAGDAAAGGGLRAEHARRGPGRRGGDDPGRLPARRDHERLHRMPPSGSRAAPDGPASPRSRPGRPGCAPARQRCPTADHRVRRQDSVQLDEGTPRRSSASTCRAIGAGGERPLQRRPRRARPARPARRRSASRRAGGGGQSGSDPAQHVGPERQCAARSPSIRSQAWSRTGTWVRSRLSQATSSSVSRRGVPPRQRARHRAAPGRPQRPVARQIAAAGAARAGRRAAPRRGRWPESHRLPGGRSAAPAPPTRPPGRGGRPRRRRWPPPRPRGRRVEERALGRAAAEGSSQRYDQ